MSIQWRSAADFCASAVWFILLTTGWSIAIGLAWTVWADGVFHFAAQRPSTWLALRHSFLAGGSVRFDFAASLAIALLLILAGTIFLALRLPTIVTLMPALPNPLSALANIVSDCFAAGRRAGASLPVRRQRSAGATSPAPLPRLEPPLAPTSDAPSPPVAPPITAETTEMREKPGPDSADEAAPPTNGDAACLARLFALSDVWDDPAPDWMTAALGDDVAALSPEGWQRMTTLGDAGRSLLELLIAQGLLPKDPPLLAVLDKFRQAPATTAPAPAPQSGMAPTLTLGAAWLCELLDNFLGAAAPTIASAAPGGETIEAMIGRAMRGMTESDWASLDRFPEKAGHVRVLTDRLGEALRGQLPSPLAPPTAGALVELLLQQFGFSVEHPEGGGQDGAMWLGRRGDLLLLAQLIDLQDKQWIIPEGSNAPWQADGGPAMASPTRQLRQRLALLRLRHAAACRPAGLTILHRGSLADEDKLAPLVEQDRRTTSIAMTWLSDAGRPLPDLRHALIALTETPVRARHPAAASERVAWPP